MPKVRFSLRLKLTFGLILIIGVIFAGINLFNLLSHQRARRQQTLLNTETIARLVAGTLVAELANSELESASNKTFLQNMLSATFNTRNKDLAYAVVINGKGNVIAGRAKPELVIFPDGSTLKKEKEVIQRVAKLKGKLGSVMRTKRFPLQLSGKIIGTVIVGTSLARVQREAKNDLIINLAILAVALLILLVYSALTLGSWVTRPLDHVVDAMRSVHDGDLSQQLDVVSRDEMGMLAHTYNFMVEGLRERETLKDAFSRYVSDKVYQRLGKGGLTLTGEMRQGTVLFSDIRSFTNLSEKLQPGEVVTLLNEYFNEMVEIVFKYDGFLNKFIGDALMAIYNVPIDQDSAELRAVRTAVEMTHALHNLNNRRKQRGQFEIKIGIGINTGPLIAGNIGHEKRMEYTVIGDTVNLAQRIESQTKVAGRSILVSDTTYNAVQEHVTAEPLPPVKVKGKAEPVKLYAITGLNS